MSVTSNSRPSLIHRSAGFASALTLLAVLLAPNVLLGAIPAGQRQALIDLYNGTGGDSWSSNTGWKQAPLDVDGFAMPGTEGTWFGVCAWDGATCSGGSDVTAVALNGNNLVGTIPASIGNLIGLQYLRLSSNPSLSGSLPSSISSLSALIEFEALGDSLSGSIPAGIGSKPSLQQLLLSGNQLSGTIPPEIGTLTALTDLALAGNQLSGSIPAEIGLLVNLQNLYLRANALSGAIPTEMGNLASILRLSLDGNMLTGPIPLSMGNLTTLISGQLDLTWNGLYTTDGGLLAFLNSRQADGNWVNSQTVAPSNIVVGTVTETSIELTWNTILYNGGTGYYEVLGSLSPGGPYAPAGQTIDKLQTSFTVTPLAPGTPYYFVIRTVSDPHVFNANTVTSDDSPEVPASTLSCGYLLNPTNDSPPGSGAVGLTFDVQTTPGCPWTAVSNDPAWITVTGGASGAGPGTVTYDVFPNPGGPRVGTITAGGETFTVNQGPGCTYVLNPTSAIPPAGGAAGLTFDVQTAGGCVWYSGTNDSWITITGGMEGNGPGTVTYDVAVNPGPAREGTILVEDQIFTVLQEDGCSFTLIPASANPPAAGATGVTFQVTTGPACAWMATANHPWLTLTSGFSGMGNDTVTFDVAANAGPLRVGTIDIASGFAPRRGGTINAAVETFTVTQADGCTFALNPTIASPPAAGATGQTFQVLTGVDCPWTAVSNDAWITITGGLSGSGTGIVTYDVAANPGPARVGTITAGGQTFTVNQADGCTSSTTLNPTSANPPSAGATGQTFQVQAAVGCPWTAVSNDAWITITGGLSGSGTGIVTYDVAANPGPARVGTITAGGQTFTVNQPVGCSYQLSPGSVNAPAPGVTGQAFQVLTALGCAWTAVSNDAWITITAGASGSDTGSVTYDIAANPGPARVGTITAGGQTFTVSQADGCTSSTTLIPASVDIAAAGTSFQAFQVNAAGGCAWTAVSNAAWITVTVGASGNGPGSVTYSVAANVGPARIGTITAGGQTFTVNQAGGCSYLLNPTTANPPAGGASAQTFEVQTASGCAWTAISNDTWITVTGGASGSGNGPVTYTVAANVGPARIGTITAGGQPFTVNQPDGCAANISLVPVNDSVQAAGTAGQSFQVLAPASCSWTASSNASWITLTSGLSGTGNGAVIYSVGANAGPARTGTITAGGQTFTVNQADGCEASISLNPTSAGAVAAGVPSQTFQVLAPASCSWTANANVNWIRITSGTSGAGSAIVAYAVDPNTGPRRSGTITAGGKTFTVSQDDGCDSSISIIPPISSVPAAGAAGQTFTVEISAGCTWAGAVANSSWITLTSGTSGTGSTPVTYDVDRNSGPPRTGTITAAGRTHTVHQDGGCEEGTTMDPSSMQFSAEGATDQSFLVLTGASCSWTAISDAPWITVVSGTAGSGSGTVSYNVAANNGAARTGTIIASGQSFTISQSDACTANSTIAPTSSNVPATAVQGLTFQVTAPASCSWTAASNNPWITITSGAAGIGSGPVTFSVDANDGLDRIGTISVAGKTYTVRQFAGCYAPSKPQFTSYPGTPVVAGNSFTAAWGPAPDLPETGFYEVLVSGNSGCTSPTSSTTTELSVTVQTEPGKAAVYCIQVRAVAGGTCGPQNASDYSSPVIVNVRPQPAEFTVIEGQSPAARVNRGDAPPTNSTVVFRNVGDATGILTLSTTSGFFTVSREGPLEVAPGTDVAVGILFRAESTSTAGVKTGDLVGSWTTADGNQSVATGITLTVLEGESPSTEGIKLEPLGSDLIYFRQVKGERGQQRITIRNSGALPVRIAPAIGADGSWLSIEGDFSSPIPPYNERSFDVFANDPATKKWGMAEDTPPPLSTTLGIDNVDGNPDDSAVFNVFYEQLPPPVEGTNRNDLTDQEFSLILGSSVSTIGSSGLQTRESPGGTKFYSEGWIRNRGPDSVSVDFYFTPEGAEGLTDPRVKKNTIVLDGYTTYRLSDFVTGLFRESGSGRVELRSAQLPQISVRSTVDSIVSHDGVPMQYGAELPVLVSGQGTYVAGPTDPLERILLGGLKGPLAGYRSNIICAETLGKPIEVRARLFDLAGKKLGEKTIFVKAYSKSQVDSGDPDLFPVPYRDGTVEITPVSGEGAITAFATVLDNSSQSYAMRLGTVLERPRQAARSLKALSKAFSPVIAREKSTDAFYTTRLSVTNGSDSDVTLQVTFIPDQGYGEITGPEPLVIPKPETSDDESGPKALTFADVLKDLLGIEEGTRGMLKFEGALEGLVFASETTTPIDLENPELGNSISSLTPAPGADSKFPGVFSVDSQEVTGMKLTDSDTVKSEVSLPAIEDGTQYRSNLILAELAGQSAKVRILLRTAGGASLGTPLVVDLAPNERKQINRIIPEIIKPPSGTSDFKDIEIITQAVEGKGRTLALVSKVSTDPKSKRIDTFVLGPNVSGSAKRGGKK